MRFIFVLMVVSIVGFSCSSGPKYKTQKYAKLKVNETYERQFSSVWKSLEKVLKHHHIIERDPGDVSDSELKDLDERQLKTDWVYGTSKDKYVEYKVNGFPRKKYLPIRFQYHVTVKSVTGGVNVEVLLKEQIQKLDDHGKPVDYTSVGDFDTSRAKDLLDQIRLALYAN